MPIRKLVSSDWALKRLLRSKANFEVLEGFLSELFRDDIVNIVDALSIARYVVNLASPSAINTDVTNVNNDATITTANVY